ncbi:CU044_5270 family protein [Nocardiopsis dassonvillei]|uniref:CU044_5270 family protein n=1 Tax=Nocardiopsis dassonvillei TaxID=2014 RepID=UPI00200F523F|nr:CU044_5270 family protein [Nocardiopsis dassonvillei]MCK9870637.1 CU044_5270 family protein [Nocardiopsis dassonvillei]
MNELDHLRRMRAEVREPGIEELALRTGWRPDGDRPPPRPRPVSLLPLTLSGAAVLVAAAVFAFLVLGPIDLMEPDTITAGPGPASSEESGGADAMEVMGPVIEAARDREGADGPVWHQRYTWGTAWGVGPDDDRYGVYRVYEEERWMNLERNLSTNEITSTDWSLVDEDDRPAWERDGSPTFWAHDPETGRPEIPTAEEDDGPADATGTSYGFGYGFLNPQELRELPSDPGRLEEILWAEPYGEDVSEEVRAWLPEEGYHSEAEQRLSLLVSTLDLPLPPEVRAGVYEVLAGMPGVRAAGVTEDMSGRAAVGVAYDLGDAERGRYEERVLFDPGTGLPLSVERVVVEPAASEADWSEPGDVVRYRLYEATGWTDEWPDVFVHPLLEE